MNLEISGLTVEFGATTALADVDLTVRSQEVVAVLGPSGSGKSTLLRVVAGLQTPTAGTVRLDGRDLARVPPHRRGVGLMFQDHVLFPHKNVAGNLRFGNAGADVEALLDLVGLAGAADRRIDTLSGGEQQRTALARALAPAPGLLMLDEPLGQLDRVLRDRLVRDLRGLFVRLGTTVLAVTHDQREAFALADRVVIMERGRVVQAGPPRTVWEQPASEFVARFLGFTNLARALVTQGFADTPWGRVPVPPGTPEGTRTVLVRPAGVLLTPMIEDDGNRAGAASVDLSSFAGETVELVLAVPGAPPLEAHVPPATAPARGEKVLVSFDPAQVVVLD